MTDVKCGLCGVERAEVFCACTYESGMAYDCDDNLVPYDEDSPDIVFTKSCAATDITYICGWCVCYVACDHNEGDMPERPSKTEIRTRYETPLTMVDYMIDVVMTTPLQPAEDGSMCGYRDLEGNVIIIICSYELCGEDRATVAYSGPRKRRIEN